MQMKDILEILGETMLIATFQPRRERNTTPSFDERLTEAATRFRPERKADRKRTW
jgi:hypothetical protein